jgi:selenide,water dikinase
VLRRLELPTHPDLLVGTATSDDAAVWRLDADRALVVTADFITPIVDDPRVWGRIAAANAVSDVYAMGGRPILALNLVGWNTEELSNDILLEVLQGAGEAAREGGWVTVGGHTVDDPEPKFGMAVVGEVHPDRILTNAGLRPGDSLVLTKALGVGVIATAMKAGKAPDAVVAAAVASMTRLNREAAAQALHAGATGATDVTGFGLLGHLRSMAEASKVDVDLDVGAIPLIPGVPALVADGFVPGGTRRNLAWARERLEAGDVDEATVIVLADAQTSGGLLFGAEPVRAEEAVAALRASGHAAAVIGTVVAGAGTMRLHA